MPETGPVDFYGGPFSNFSPSEFSAPNAWGEMRTYATVEHYFASWKAATQEDADFVLAAGGAYDCWKVKARGREIALRPDWEEIKYDVMVEGLRYKFALGNYKYKLLNTGDREMREDSPTDFEWGYRNNGKNLLGKALMQVRAELRERQSK